MAPTRPQPTRPCILLCALIVGTAVMVAVPTGAQDAPHWAMHETFAIPVPQIGMPMIVELNADLYPKDSTLFHDYQRRKEESLRKFEEKRKELEDSFQAATGDAKIAAAEELIQFVVAAIQEWQTLHIPTSGDWQGLHTIVMRMGERLLQLRGRLPLELTITQTGQQAGKGSIRGQANEGTIVCQMNLEDLFPPEMRQYSLGTFDFDQTWEADITGEIKDGRMFLVLPASTQEGTGTFGADIILFGGLGGAMVRGTTSIKDGQGRISTHGYAWAAEILVPAQTSPRTYSQQDYCFSLGYRYEEEDPLDLQQLLEGYFVRYVKTLDEVRQAQYGATTDGEKKQNLAWQVLGELIEAESWADLLGVSPGAVDSAGLLRYAKGFLYDNWFRYWFSAGWAYWDEKVAASRGGARIDHLLQRFGFLLTGMKHSDIFGPDPATLRELQLFEQSPLLDRCYGEYFQPCLQQWCDDLRARRCNLDDALKWLSFQVETIACGGLGYISSQKAGALGLTGKPCQAERQLQAAAGGM